MRRNTSSWITIQLLLLACFEVKAFIAPSSTRPKNNNAAVLSPPPTSCVLYSSRNNNNNDNSSSPFPTLPLKGVTSELISQLAIVALKIRLDKQSSVECKVNARTRDMLSGGKIGPVTVSGKGWRSPLGLTCRLIEATVSECSLDFQKVVQNRKLHLITPSKGNAMIALNEQDFGNFVTHPLLTKKDPPLYLYEGNPGKIELLKDGVIIDPKDGSVQFKGVFMEQYEFLFRLSRGDEQQQNTNDGSRDAKIEAILLPSTTDANNDNIDDKEILEKDISKIMSDYFTNLNFDLDGTMLSFRDMMVTDKGRQPSLMLALSIVVKKFPSPGIAF